MSIKLPVWQHTFNATEKGELKYQESNHTFAAVNPEWVIMAVSVAMPTACNLTQFPTYRMNINGIISGGQIF